MKLSKTAFHELSTKCAKRFPELIGTSMHNSSLWANFCDKKPAEFILEVEFGRITLRINSDGYAICDSRGYHFFRIYSFKIEE